MMFNQLLSGAELPYDLYLQTFNDRSKFRRAALGFLNSLPEKLMSKIAYPFAKEFVIWYTKQMAKRCGQRNIRMLYVSPGSVDTPMIQKEREISETYKLTISGQRGNFLRPYL